MEENEENILPDSHPIHKRVESVVTRILEANKEIEAVSQRNWKITVINDDTVNAMVTPVSVKSYIFWFYSPLH